MRILNLTRKIFFVLSVLLTASTLNAADYLDRPDVLGVKAANHNASIMTIYNSWEKFKLGTANFLPFLYAANPNSRIYFLARDGEYMYDLAKILTKDQPELVNRTDLIPINRYVSDHPETFQPYLSQLGFDQMLSNPQEDVLFVDTCCSGSIPRKIKNSYNKAGKIRWHFVDGGNADTPMSHLFYEPTDGFGARSNIGGTIEGYPHYHSGIQSITLSQGKYIANSTVGDQVYLVEQMQADLRHTFDNKAARDLFRAKVKYIRVVLDYLENKQVDPAEFKTALDFLSSNKMKSLAQEINEMTSRSPRNNHVVDATKMQHLENYFAKGTPIVVDNAKGKKAKEKFTPPAEPVVEVKHQTPPKEAPMPEKKPVAQTQDKQKLKTLHDESLASGDQIALPPLQGTFHYVDKADKWKHLRGSEIKDQNNSHFIVYRADDPEDAKDLERIKDYLQEMQQHNIPTPHVTSGNGFVALYKPIGERADKWLKDLEKGKVVDKQQRLPKMMQFFEKLVAQKIYLEIEPKDLSWDGHEWVITNPVRVSQKSSSSHLKKKYRKLIREEWTKKNASCYSVFSPLWES